MPKHSAENLAKVITYAFPDSKIARSVNINEHKLSQNFSLLSEFER